MDCFRNSSATFTKIVAILHNCLHSYIHLQVIIEKYREIFGQSARGIFDIHQCIILNNTNYNKLY